VLSARGVFGEEIAVTSPVPRLSDFDDQVLVVLEGLLDLLT
jgi:hypothetical protein